MERPKLDIGKIRDRVADIQGSVGELRELTSQPLDAFVADKRNVYATAHLFLVAIEAVASICNHILSRLARRAPGTYDECFQSLAELRIVPNPLAEALVLLARFRNLLVRRYWEFGSDELYEYTKAHLSIFDEFLRHLTRWLQGEMDETEPAGLH